MSPTLSAIQALFSKIAYRGDQHTDFILQECAPNAKISNIHMQAGGGDWVVLYPDKHRTCPHRNNTSCSVNSPHLAIGATFFHHQVCDGILIIQDGERINLAYFDLKSTSIAGVTKQFKSMKYFMRYAVSLAEQNISIAKECAFCFKCINPKTNQKDTFHSNSGASAAISIPVYDVRVHDRQNFNLNQFTHFFNQPRP